MGIKDHSFLNLIQKKVRSWLLDIPWFAFSESSMPSSIDEPSFCHECHSPLMTPNYKGHRCRSCGRIFCVRCMYFPSTSTPENNMSCSSEDTGYPSNLCNFCSKVVSQGDEFTEGYCQKLQHTISPSEFLNGKIVHAEMLQHTPLDLSFSSTRSSGENDKDCRKHAFSSPSLSSQDASELENSSISPWSEFCESNPFGSPYSTDNQCESDLILPRVSTPKSECEEENENLNSYENTTSIFRNLATEEVQKPFDLENNSLIWLPPPPKDLSDDTIDSSVQFDEEKEDTGGTLVDFKSCSFNNDTLLEEEDNDTLVENDKTSIYTDFRALVFHFLKVEGVPVSYDRHENNWLDIVSSLSWQAANYVKPNTRRGGSMDPGDYVKVKRISTGSPRDSTFIKGVVCTRNVKHKRMITQHSSPKLLILGGALEYQKVSNKLASINTVLEQESSQLKMHFSRIEAHKPNVVLVEKTVSPQVVDYMLAKGISLVSNVKRSLLEQISRCTDARITNSVDDLPLAKLGQCETFHVDRVYDEFSGSQFNKKSSKTLMFFESCPNRLGCTILLRGACLEELKNVKHAMQYAIFAAYHLSLETSFLADEGASRPQLLLRSSNITKEMHHAVMESRHVDYSCPFPFQLSNVSSPDLNFHYNCFKEAEMESAFNHYNHGENSNLYESVKPTFSREENESSSFECKHFNEQLDYTEDKFSEIETKTASVDMSKVSSGHLPASENNQSILVSLSKSCVPKGLTCEGPQLFRIKFYGTFDKPLGTYLCEYIFDQMPCQSCKDTADAHVMCYTHQNGNLTISVKRLSSTLLPGEDDGKIWMWHRCLKCAHENGTPPAARRVVMSDAAGGLSFGKFLELSFSNHSSANRIAGCGHSLQRDCLRFFGLGKMIACFRYSPVEILSVRLPLSILEFSSQLEREWIYRETVNLSSEVEILFQELIDVLCNMEHKISGPEYEDTRADLLSDITYLKDLLHRKKRGYDGFLLQADVEAMHFKQKSLDILELNNLRRSLVIDSYMWNCIIYRLDSLVKDKRFRLNIESCGGDGSTPKKLIDLFSQSEMINSPLGKNDIHTMDRGYAHEATDLESIQSNLSEKIDLAWIGSCQPTKAQVPNNSVMSIHDLQHRKVMSPVRVNSFDSALSGRNRSHLLSPSFLSASNGDGSFINETIPSIRRVNSQCSPRDSKTLRFLFGQRPEFVKSSSRIVSDGARLLLPESLHDDICIAVYDNEPSSIISYAICSKEHVDFAGHELFRQGPNACEGVNSKDDRLDYQSRSTSPLVAQKISISGSGDTQSQSNWVSEALPSRRTISLDPKQYHFRFSFDDNTSFPADKVKFSVTCYFAKQFSALRMKCCPSEMDFVRSLSRCKKWTAQGGKSNVYFAKSLDERFIFKQVTKTELDAFEEFAPSYFEYLTESIKSGSPTCLAKVLGIYQITIKHLRGGKEEKMDLMVMENLFFGRTISRVYDLKGSSRSRYIPDTTGSNQVLLDLNLLETLRTNPIFLGSKSKRRLERAVWNDTAFLSSVYVMDYSLLVGVDIEKKELVIGIIDFMRQYTWDKQLETWVKASGFLGGSKNASPTVVSPDVYKKRFRKAMSSYFLSVPDQWSS